VSPITVNLIPSSTNARGKHIFDQASSKMDRQKLSSAIVDLNQLVFQGYELITRALFDNFNFNLNHEAAKVIYQTKTFNKEKLVEVIMDINEHNSALILSRQLSLRQLEKKLFNAGKYADQTAGQNDTVPEKTTAAKKTSNRKEKKQKSDKSLKSKKTGKKIYPVT
jgi:hypothetical protein